MSGDLTTHHKHLPSCGQCGYPAQGLESFQCPECGEDLREVGIYPRRCRPLINRRLSIAIFYTIALFILTLPFAQPFSESIPKTFRDTQSIVMSPDSGTFRVVALTLERDLQQTAHQRWSIPDLMLSEASRFGSRITLSFGPEQSNTINRRLFLDFQAERDPETGAIKEARLEVDFTANSFELIQQGKSIDRGKLPLKRSDVRMAFEAIGVPHANTTSYRDADELFGVITQAQHQSGVAEVKGFRYQETSYRGYFLSSTDKWEFGYLIFWVFIWLLGLFFIVIKQTRTNPNKNRKNIELAP